MFSELLATRHSFFTALWSVEEKQAVQNWRTSKSQKFPGHMAGTCWSHNQQPAQRDLAVRASLSVSRLLGELSCGVTFFFFRNFLSVSFLKTVKVVGNELWGHSV